jgi:hypothetical protein
MTDTASFFVAFDYRSLMGALIERKIALGLTNLEIDELGGLAGGYTSKLFCGSKRLGLETLGRLLTALGTKVVVVPADAELALPKLTKNARFQSNPCRRRSKKNAANGAAKVGRSDIF